MNGKKTGDRLCIQRDDCNRPSLTGFAQLPNHLRGQRRIFDREDGHIQSDCLRDSPDLRFIEVLADDERPRDRAGVVGPNDRTRSGHKRIGGQNCNPLTAVFGRIVAK